jgi:hypothetical protein
MTRQKRSELANLLRKLADYVDNRSDAELAPLFELAQRLKPDAPIRRPDSSRGKVKKGIDFYQAFAKRLNELQSREEGEALLIKHVPRRRELEALARVLQLPVQRDDTMERLRAKIVENGIGSRLRSQAIQGTHGGEKLKNSDGGA